MFFKYTKKLKHNQNSIQNECKNKKTKKKIKKDLYILKIYQYLLEQISVKQL